MKGGDVKINIAMSSVVVGKPELLKKGNGGGEERDYTPMRDWMRSLWEFGKEDTNRVVFSLKLGFAMILVSMLILLRVTYDVFGENIIWSMITVAIMFEYTVGATFNKGFNRALGSMFAGLFAIVVIEVADSAGHIIEPYVIGLSIFLIGAVTSFLKLWPPLVPYEYGFRVTLFTYCMIIGSGYRMGNPIRTSMDRLYSIAIGGLVAVLVNVLICPMWAGEQLHRQLVTDFSSVAESLEECVNKYLQDDGTEKPEFTKTVMDDFSDEPAFKKCQKTLSLSAKLESLAIAAKWEPPHGKFRQFFYPWPEYVKVGTVLRHCAYEVVALHGCLHSEIQAPFNLRLAFQSEILTTATQAAELLRTLAKEIANMTHTTKQILILKQLHNSTEHLQRSINLHSYLFTTTSHDHHTSNPKHHNHNNNDNHASDRSYHENMKTRQKRLHSWPSRELDEETLDSVDSDELPKMRAFESTTALSIATFSSLLIEFVARLDHLVDAVEELAKLAKFEEEQS